jgi:hypothetical protein
MNHPEFDTFCVWKALAPASSKPLSTDRYWTMKKQEKLKKS